MRRRVPENVLKVFYFLVTRPIDFTVIKECSGIGHRTCIHLQQNKMLSILIWCINKITFVIIFLHNSDLH